MYISELNLHGFKSFAKKEKLKFGEGVTVIVGPNGCGKTNIVDAIRWVLGEQKYSILRSSKMGDVIFNGADGLKPLSVCEAFLTVHNNRGKLPLEYNDIEIGRRVYRDGESEYFINRTPCRLKDIHDLFVDTGMGSDAYSVIELKMIEQILSETADDRKRMFEEAAGINKYKQQRRSALRKFDAVQQDLERINDIVQEVEQKVNSLNLQLKRFKRHEKLSEELKERELALAFVRVHEFESEITPLRRQVVEFTHLKDEKSSHTSVYEAELEKLKTFYSKQQSELHELQNSLRTLEEHREEIKNNVLVCSEQDKAAEANIDRLERETVANADKQTTLKVQAEKHDKELMDISPKLEDQLSLYKLKKSEFDSVEKEYKSAQEYLEKTQNARWDVQRKMTDDRSILDRTQSLIEEKNNGLSRIKDKIKTLKTVQNDYSIQQKDLEAKKIGISTVVEDLEAKLKEARASMTSNQENRTDLSFSIQRSQSNLESLVSQVAFYEELIEQKEGYPKGVKAILDAPKEYAEVIGTVGDLFQIDEKYSLAFQSALGDWAKCIVATNRKAALGVLSSAKKNDLGNLTIIPLKELNEKTVEIQKAPKGKGIVGVGSALCGASTKLQSLANMLVGDLLIVEDLVSALDAQDLGEWNVVDLNGAYIGKNQLFKHRGKSAEGSLMGRQKKIESLNEKIQSISAQIQSDESALSDLDSNIDEISAQKSVLNKQLAENSDELNEIETDLIRNHYKQSQTLESVQSLQNEEKETEKSLNDLNASSKQLQPKLKEWKAKITDYESQVDDASARLGEVQLNRDKSQQAAQELRIELLNLENRRDNFNFQKRIAEDTIQELKERQARIRDEIKIIKENSSGLRDEINLGQEKLQTISGQLLKDRSVVDLKQGMVNETYQSMEEIQTKIRSEQQSREALLEELKTNELKIVEMEQRVNIIRERIKDRYDMDVPDNLVVDDEPDDLEMRIERINRSIESIGPINMAVQQECEDEQRRLKMLTEQRIDLVASEDNLRETIQRIDRVARKKFQETFDQIKLNFSNLFSMFFEGGTASLSLIGDPDPLEADIAIHAQPPGKKNQSLRMLSAGEKSLTAIALLFAIYQYKPSPYCILDEVDAPLDDVNIQKFKKVLNSFADDTQFIVVTHNKLTMEAADYLYGVTMEQKGVSKLVSVKFEGES